jgi:hypothetical protein
MRVRLSIDYLVSALKKPVFIPLFTGACLAPSSAVVTELMAAGATSSIPISQLMIACRRKRRKGTNVI